MKRDEVATLLTEGVRSLLDSDTFKKFLEFRRKFYNYSWHNCLLILCQSSEATWVAGYRKWQELGRYVKSGEKGIGILAPLIKKIEDEGSGEKTKTLYGFRVVHVFDISQTEGEELPIPPSPQILYGDDCGVVARLRAFATREGWQVLDEQPTAKDAHGSCHHNDRVIRLHPDRPPLQRAKTLAHEVAHSRLHGVKDGVQELVEPFVTERAFKEVEAESVAYVVLTLTGFDTSQYSFPYVAHWLAQGSRPDIKTLTERLELILTTADWILDGIAEPVPPELPPDAHLEAHYEERYEYGES